MLKSVIILCAGSSTRMGFDKIFEPLCGMPVFAHSVNTFVHSGADEVIIVMPDDEKIERAKNVFGDSFCDVPIKYAKGGKTRSKSARNAMAEIHPESDIVIIHDGARPLFSEKECKAFLQNAEMHEAIICATKVTDTIKECENGVIKGTVDRTRLYGASTPQAFRTALYKKAIATDGEATDDASLVEALGTDVSVFECSKTNIKLTTAEDFIIARAILNGRREENAENR